MLFSHTLGSVLFLASCCFSNIEATTPTAQQKADLIIVLAPKFDLAKLDNKPFADLKARLIGNAAAYNSAILDLYLGPNFDVAVLPQSPIIEVVRRLHPHDPKGSLEVAKALKVSVDNCLTVYDLVKDKKVLFDMVSAKDAQKIKGLVKYREKVADLIAGLEKAAPLKKPRQ